MKCEYCEKTFVENEHCITLLTMHVLVRHSEEVTKNDKKTKEFCKK